MAKSKTKAKAVYTGPKRAAIYTRVSSAEQALNGTSLGLQREALTAWVEEQGWVIVGVWEEGGVSGWKGEADRPALHGLMTAARDSQVDVLVCDKWDRLGRNVNEQTTLWASLDDLGVEYVSRSEPGSSGRDGAFMRHVMAAVAEQERDRIRARTVGGRVARLKQGGWSGGEPPLGFRVEHDSEGRSPRLALHDGEAAMIRRAVGLLLDEGMTTGEAAQVLNAEGLVPRKAGRWHAALLRNHLMRGPWGGVWTYAKPSGRLKGRDLLPELVEVPVPRVLEADRHAALVTYLKGTTLPKTRTHVHPLSGLLIGSCGHTYTGVARRDRGRRRYRCSCQKDTGKGWTCPAPTVIGQALDDMVWAQVVAILRDPDALQAEAAKHLGAVEAGQQGLEVALAQAEAKVLQTRTALAGASMGVLKQGLDDATAAVVLDGLKADLVKAEGNLTGLAAMCEQTSAQRQGLEAVHEVALNLGEALEQADAALRAEVFGLLGVQVRVVELGAEGEPLRVQVDGTNALGLLGVSAGQSPSPQNPGVLSFAKRTSR